MMETFIVVAGGIVAAAIAAPFVWFDIKKGCGCDIDSQSWMVVLRRQARAYEADPAVARAKSRDLQLDELLFMRTLRMKDRIKLAQYARAR